MLYIASEAQSKSSFHESNNCGGVIQEPVTLWEHSLNIKYDGAHYIFYLNLYTYNRCTHISLHVQDWSTRVVGPLLKRNSSVEQRFFPDGSTLSVAQRFYTNCSLLISTGCTR